MPELVIVMNSNATCQHRTRLPCRQDQATIR